MMNTTNLEALDLVNPRDFGIKANQMWWAGEEAKIRYGAKDSELAAIGITSTDILISGKLIPSLQNINRALKDSHALEIVIDDGYRSPELYQYAAKKVAERKGGAISKSLFNLEKMPHALGTSIDVGLAKIETSERVRFFDINKDGLECSFLGFYEKLDEPRAREFIRLQKLLGEVFLANGFRYGSKNEVWHFDFVI